MTRVIYREHFHACMPICESGKCGHWGARPDDPEGRTGCLLIKKGCVCRIANHLLAGGGCLDDPQQFPATPT